MATTPVRVALRVRPLSAKEQSDNCAECITFAQDEPQIFLGTDKAFTFDSVFQSTSTQEEVFSACIAPLVHRYLEGNNVTILAYGQTGSGKTYSMGTGPATVSDHQDGIVQRFAHALFNTLEQQHEQNHFQVYASFLELYHEDIRDLLDQETATSSETHPSIREDMDGNVYLTGVREYQVRSADELLSVLSKGIQLRATGSTDANTSSSRSHAVFSVLLKQQVHSSEATTTSMQQRPLKRLASKFHFVDLAGSERLKRTMGDRQKEGISINTGLLALGNVISALGDESRKGAHVPYRDSKLTRLLQGSLGGSSQTLMLACVSSADQDYMKTLNTLKYASRARNIQNRVEINHDYEGSPEELDFLRAKVKQLKMQVSMLQTVTGDAHIIGGGSGGAGGTGHYELERMRKYNQDIANELARVQSERDTLLAQQHHEETIGESHPVIREYAETVQDLRLQLAEAQSKITHLATAFNKITSSSTPPPLHIATSSSAISDITVTKSTVAATATAYASQSTSAVHSHYRPVMTLSGRRRGKYVPIATRILRQRRQQVKPSPSNSIFYTKEDSIQAPNISDYANNTLFVWSQSQDETVIQDLSPPSAGSRIKEAFDHNHDSSKDGRRDLNGNTTRPDSGLPAAAAAAAPLQQLPSYCEPALSDVDDDTMSDFGNELEALQVPAWTDTPQAHSTIGSTSKRESLSWTDSFLDDSDNSVATSRLSSSWTTAGGTATTMAAGIAHSDTRCRSRAGSTASEAANRRRSKDLLKMLHQVQADLLVKQELVGQLEKSEDEFAQMQSTYVDKLVELQEHLEETEKERDDALQRQTPTPPPVPSVAASTARRPTTKAAAATPTTPLLTSRPSGLGLREARQADDVRRQYELKVKKLTTENIELKRKYTQTNNTLQSAKAKAEQYIQKLHAEISTLKMEKKTMTKAHKAELDKVREASKDHEYQAHVLKRKELVLLEAKKKLEDQYEQQAQLAKKRTEETAALAAQMRQMTFALRRAATEGPILNEAFLDKMLSQSQQQQRPSKSPTAMRRIPSEQ